MTSSTSCAAVALIQTQEVYNFIYKKYYVVYVCIKAANIVVCEMKCNENFCHLLLPRAEGEGYIWPQTQ